MIIVCFCIRLACHSIAKARGALARPEVPLAKLEHVGKMLKDPELLEEEQNRED